MDRSHRYEQTLQQRAPAAPPQCTSLSVTYTVSVSFLWLLLRPRLKYGGGSRMQRVHQLQQLKYQRSGVR